MQQRLRVDDGRRKPKIMAVDDEPMILRYLIGVLCDVYSVKVFTEGETALTSMKREKPDLILLDLCMPGMDGSALFDEIRRHPQLKDVPVIFLTGKRDAESILADRLNSGAECIYKPVAKNDLLNEIATQLNRREIDENQDVENWDGFVATEDDFQKLYALKRRCMDAGGPEIHAVRFIVSKDSESVFDVPRKLRCIVAVARQNNSDYLALYQNMTPEEFEQACVREIFNTGKAGKVMIEKADP